MNTPNPRSPITAPLAAKAPVRYLPSDEPSSGLRDEVGLSLSGGGYRAMLFHTGALWRLNELGLLGAIDRYSSVSGGSIAAGYLGRRWDALRFDEEGIASNFIEAYVAGIRRLAGVTVDVWSVLKGLFIPPWVAEWAARYYDRYLFRGAGLENLPDYSQDQGPRFTLNATNLGTGDLWRFLRSYMGDWRIGIYKDPAISLARAVAASAAFPPVLSPVILNLDPEKFDMAGANLKDPAFRSRIVLVDGGVYDNLGLETIWKRCKTVLVSDGGAKEAELTRPPVYRRLCQLVRVTGITDQQIVFLRIRQLIESYRLGHQDGEGDDGALARKGAYWGIHSKVADFDLPDPFPFPEKEAEAAAATPTRLKALSDRDQERLINWGYVICDTAVRKYYNPEGRFKRPTQLPYSR